MSAKKTPSKASKPNRKAAVKKAAPKKAPAKKAKAPAKAKLASKKAKHTPKAKAPAKAKPVAKKTAPKAKAKAAPKKPVKPAVKKTVKPALKKPVKPAVKKTVKPAVKKTASPKLKTAPRKSSAIVGKVFLLGDNIDTDQIIPAQYLNLVPTIPEEYEKLGSYALCGLPDSVQPRYISKGGKTEYPIVIGSKNFGCGSSREHAPVSLGAAGCKAVIALSFARIFFRNCIATGEVYPVESDGSLATSFKTGDVAELDLESGSIKNLRTGKVCMLKPLGDAKLVIEAGGIFNYARKTGMF